MNMKNFGHSALIVLPKSLLAKFLESVGAMIETCRIPTKRGGKWSHKQVSRILKRLNVDKND